MELFGREKLYTAYEEVTEENLIEILNRASIQHKKNISQEDYLWQYYKGKQPILERVKEVRPEICNKIVNNIAAEIVDWKSGYQLGSPATYVCLGSEEGLSEAVYELNNFMRMAGKDSSDKKLVDDMLIYGVGYRMVLPSEEEDICPFALFNPDPQQAFVVYSNRVGHKPMLGVYLSETEDHDRLANVYTADWYYLVKNGNEILISEPHPYGGIPIFEYELNSARIGAFESVLPILDAINLLDSNRVDGVQNAIEQLCVAYNIDMDGITANEIRESGLICLKNVSPEAKADFKILESSFNQADSQTLKDDLTSAYLSIVGMPNRGKDGGGTSDNGVAVIYRNGFTDAEARAQNMEMQMKRIETKFLRIVRKFTSEIAGLDFSVSAVDWKFLRRLYDNIQTKSQVLVTMLNNEKVDPLLAFEACGMFSDAEAAYQMSMKYFEENRSRNEAMAQIQLDRATEQTEQPVEQTEGAADGEQG